MSSGIFVGTVIANRFVISALAGTGGMSSVYKAHDLYTASPVALKFLHPEDSQGLMQRRFGRESAIIAQLHHAGIPRWVTSGKAKDGRDYLAMEWLNGESLSSRLERSPLTVRECQSLLEQVASVLACIHQKEIVHRDIKPSNLFLCDSGLDRVVVLDFGIARRGNPGRQTAITDGSTLVGTVGYASPEQVCGAKDVTPASDIYSLGRVAYECLMGRDPRPVRHIAAAIVRTLQEEQPPLHEVCLRVPQSLSRLIGRMLAKAPAQRIQDGPGLLHELRALGPLQDLGAPRYFEGVSAAERADLRLHTVVLAVNAATAAGDLSALPSFGEEGSAGLQQEPAETLPNLGAEPFLFPDGSLLLKVPLESSVHDQAARAARCALLLKTRWPAADVAVATGRGQSIGPAIVGEVLDRAVALVNSARARLPASAQLAAAAASCVWVEPLSAALLERSFVLQPVDGGALLTGESPPTEFVSPVLGRHPPCLGRDPELMSLNAMLAHCQDESQAQAVLVTAPVGIGKTRLRQEFMLRLKSAAQPPTVLLGIAQSISPGAPYALLGYGLRRFLGMKASANASPADDRLLAGCIEALGDARGHAVAPFLAELCGLRWQGPESPELRAARSDPKTMAEQLLETLTSLVEAWCCRGPLVWILEDLQWGDLLSVRLIGALLRRLRDRPLMVLALARPEVKSVFPAVHEWSMLKEWPLKPLSRAASERLIHFILADKLTPSAVSELARQSGGNVLFLEELIRSASLEKESAGVNTALVMLQARLQHLDPQARLVLCRASIFGERFWRSGLLAISSTNSSEDVDAALQHLAKSELIAVRPHSAHAHDVEFCFRHSLVHEAVYGLLSDAQRLEWHARAGAYLASTDPEDSLAVAEHFTRSSEPHLGTPFFAETARRLLEGGDSQSARRCAERGLACQRDSWAEHEPERHLRGLLLHILARTQYQSLDLDAALQAGEEALRLLPTGSADWSQAFQAQFSVSLIRGQHALLRRLAAQFLAVEPQPAALASYAESGGTLLMIYSHAGQRAAALATLSRMRAVCRSSAEEDPVVAVWMDLGEFQVFRLLEGAPGPAWVASQRGSAAAAQTRNQSLISLAEYNLAICELELGQTGAEARLRSAISLLAKTRGENSQANALTWLALLLSGRPEHAEEAARLAEAQLALAKQKKSGVFSGLAQLALSRTYSATHRLRDAEAAALEAMELLEEAPPFQVGSYAQLVQLRLWAGELSAAQQAAEEGLHKLERLGGNGWMDLALRLMAGEVELASGRQERGRAALASALEALRIRAEQIPDPALRACYLSQVPENRRLLALTSP